MSMWRNGLLALCIGLSLSACAPKEEPAFKPPPQGNILAPPGCRHVHPQMIVVHIPGGIQNGAAYVRPHDQIVWAENVQSTCGLRRNN
jgi:hypothetical protein